MSYDAFTRPPLDILGIARPPHWCPFRMKLADRLAADVHFAN